MADKQLTFDEEARASLMRGVNELKRVVGLTLGPSGRNVLLSRMFGLCLLYTSPSPRDLSTSRMPSSA